jgi:hypothetical protein
VGIVKPILIMSNVRAKFVCNGVDDKPEYEQKSASFSPVTTGSEENKSFAKYTPAGSIQLSISNETPAANFFEPGKEYYVDFTAVE